MPNCSFDISDEVIIISALIVIIDVKADILSGFEYVVNGKGLAEVGIDVIFYGLGPAEGCEMVLSEISFVGDFDVGVGFAEDVEVFEAAATQEEFYPFEHIVCGLHVLSI